ncbi:transcriptional regulator family: Fungal Specific TF [Agaricus bisporus var. burnettii]|uniref:Transcriptional regulator family: Fungal Specific TF n=1 Tax=Agaricus bisporus var. burnettii TaxID=192524 RepID=A0A8H7KIS1_AGABI|nr:transcriptional regulator family: Fungal Specific TF [Agaricus bisporus var. burnettii]
MTTPPGEPSSVDNPPQPLPHQPPLPTPTQPPAAAQPSQASPRPAPRKPRQRRRTDSATPNRSEDQKSDQRQEGLREYLHPPPASYPLYPPRGPYYPPYPPPPTFVMNPSYPMGGSPYSQQHQQGGYQQQHTQVHGQPPPPHHYGPPGYPSYSAYPHPMGIPSPMMSASAGGKRKRGKSILGESMGKAGEKGSDEEGGASGSDIPRVPSAQQSQAPQTIVDLKKRTKTQRACDSCRSRKIRCDILPDVDPPICQHCKQFSFECTFFLPITETRFKKKKLEEDAANQRDKSDVSNRVATSPTGESVPGRDIGVFGPTSPYHLLHSQATINSRIYENYDLRYQHTFEVSKNGDGLITVQKPATEEQQAAHPKQIDLHVEKDVIEKLVNSYFTDVAPVLPVVTQAEFLSNTNPAPVLLYSMCLVAAARREVPSKIFDSLRFTVNNIIKADDVLSTASIANVQALLILSMTGDCHSPFVPNALSALWIRLGVAIRMAQDLGLHRAESVKQNIELRRRVWGACLICDRWTSLAYGHPYMIDVQDCDARLPSSGDESGLYMDELVRLSLLLGRVLKAIYSPAGLTFTTDEQLQQLLQDLEEWKRMLPESLKFHGPDTPRNAGILHIIYASISMMFWRVFMRISYICPAHLKFGLTVENWTELIKLTGEAIDWLDVHEEVYDVWLPVAYAMTSCALVQYHTWVRRRDIRAAEKLRQLRDCIRRWEKAINPEHMSSRRKTAEIIALLYEATQGPPLPMEAPALNPTGGVKTRPPLSLEYRKDPTRPGGGVFIAQPRTREEDVKDIPPGTIIASGADHEGSSSTASNPGHAPQRTPPPTMVNFAPLNKMGDSYGNLNPAMNSQGRGNVQVMNVLDGGSQGANLAEYEMSDIDFLEGLPGTMFDWHQWDNFFSQRFSQGHQQQLQQQQHQQQQQQQQQLQQQQLPPGSASASSQSIPLTSAPH